MKGGDEREARAPLTRELRSEGTGLMSSVCFSSSFVGTQSLPMLGWLAAGERAVIARTLYDKDSDVERYSDRRNPGSPLCPSRLSDTSHTRQPSIKDAEKDEHDACSGDCPMGGGM